MPKNVLITGASGLVGTRLTEILLEKGYEVSHLSRGTHPVSNVKIYQWNVNKHQIDPEAIKNADYIIHLAGAGIADKNWTEDRKKEIIDSRTISAKLLYDNLQKTEHHVKAVVSASGIGIYGGDSGPELMKEDSKYGNDFLAEVCKVWESSINEIQNLNIRTVVMRIGIVLSEKGGALPKLVQPIKLGAGCVLGSGKQAMSWIHIDDLCQMFVSALENDEMSGAYNAVAPNPISNKDFTKEAAEVLHRWVLPIGVPVFGLKLIFGEMISAVLSNNTVSNEKIVKAGFTYLFTDCKKALEDLLNK